MAKIVKEQTFYMIGKVAGFKKSLKKIGVIEFGKRSGMPSCKLDEKKDARLIKDIENKIVKTWIEFSDVPLEDLLIKISMWNFPMTIEILESMIAESTDNCTEVTLIKKMIEHNGQSVRSNACWLRCVAEVSKECGIPFAINPKFTKTAANTAFLHLL